MNPPHVDSFLFSARLLTLLNIAAIFLAGFSKLTAEIDGVGDLSEPDIIARSLG